MNERIKVGQEIEVMMHAQELNAPKGIVIAGLSGGSGKSVASVALVAAFANRGSIVCPFKKGPDYIDAGWLQLAAGNPCYNLDPYLMEEEALKKSFYDHARRAEKIVIEGNRGLFDGVNVEGAYSTAELAVTLSMPVILVVDCTKTTRTVAALVLGCKVFDERVDIKGVILNRLAGARHEKIVRETIAQYTGIPVVGAIPRTKRDVFPQRHLGVTPFQEHDSAETAIHALQSIADRYLDLSAIESLMQPIVIPEKYGSGESLQPFGDKAKVRIGIIRDAAFQFYYPENLHALQREGAELVEINALSEKALPTLDALYIGGGFPETSARELATNSSFRESIKENAEKGLPIYAECGGLIYLGESLVLEGKTYPLCGIFPVRFGLERKPQAHGYTILKAEADNPFYQAGTEIKGHEFRYSKVLHWPGRTEDLAFRVERGVGFTGGKDGLVYKNVLALYTHVHAIGTPVWAKMLVEKARAFKAKTN